MKQRERIMLCCVFAILYRISTGESIITTHTTCVCVFHFVQLEQQCSCSASVSNCCFVYLYLPLPFFFFDKSSHMTAIHSLTNTSIAARYTIYDTRYTAAYERIEYVSVWVLSLCGAIIVC